MNHRNLPMDPLGRSASATAKTLVAACTLLVITGSAWPIQARSGYPIFDTTPCSKYR